MASEVVAIVLAGQRPGPDRVAAPLGLKAKALAPVLGRAMIDRLLDTLTDAAAITSVIIVEDGSLEPLANAPGVAAALESGFARIMPASDKISDSVLSAIRDTGENVDYLVTTADNPLLTPEMIEDFLKDAQGSDLAVGMAERTRIEAAYPEIPRTYYQFKDRAVSGANLFHVGGAAGLKAIELWSFVEQHRKQPLRISAKFGMKNLWLMGFRRLTVADAFKRASAKAECVIRPVVMNHAEAAIDVDKPVDLLIAEAILARRALRPA